MQLYKQTVQPKTWNLLNALMKLPALSQFALVGGTNLALRFGHRTSEDIDLFTNSPYETRFVWETIKTQFPNSIKLGEHHQTLWLNIDGVKVDIILHQYPYLRPIEEIEGIRMLAVEDIIPMKLEAMATRGVKKDFWDLATLLSDFPLSEMLSFHQQKYKQEDIVHIILSMTYFDDAEKEKIDPIDLKGMTWENVKEQMRTAVVHFMRKDK